MREREKPDFSSSTAAAATSAVCFFFPIFLLPFLTWSSEIQGKKTWFQSSLAPCLPETVWINSPLTHDSLVARNRETCTPFAPFVTLHECRVNSLAPCWGKKKMLTFAFCWDTPLIEEKIPSTAARTNLVSIHFGSQYKRILSRKTTPSRPSSQQSQQNHRKSENQTCSAPRKRECYERGYQICATKLHQHHHAVEECTWERE